MNSQKDVKVFVDNCVDPVFEGTKLELSKSPVLADVMSSLNVCALCNESVCIIFAEEDWYTVVSTLDQLSVTPKEKIYQNNQYQQRGFYGEHGRIFSH